jgi:hypothetical protein
MPARDEEHEVGKASPSVSRGVSAWPARWFTPTSGRPVAAASPLAQATPDSTPPISPGPAVTAMPSMSESAPRLGQRLFHREVDPLGMGAGRDLGDHAAEPRMERRLAETTDDRISPTPVARRTTAAAVSSQLLSRPRTVTVRGMGTAGCARGFRQVTPRHGPDNSRR